MRILKPVRILNVDRFLQCGSVPENGCHCWLVQQCSWRNSKARQLIPGFFAKPATMHLHALSRSCVHDCLLSGGNESVRKLGGKVNWAY